MRGVPSALMFWVGKGHQQEAGDRIFVLLGEALNLESEVLGLIL